MRLFWALLPPPEVVGLLDPAVAALAASHPELRWTAPGTWHVTLAFMGELEDTTVLPLVEALATTVQDRPPVEVRILGEAGAPGGRRGVVWLPVTSAVPPGPDVADPLARLAEDVRTAAATVAEVDTTHQWRGHLTLARTHRHAEDPAALARTVAAAYTGPDVGWAADTLTLVHSTTSPTGAQYRTLATLSLNGDASDTAHASLSP